MTLTASRTSKGFERHRNEMGFYKAPVLWELTPNTAFSKGDMLVLTSNRAAKAATNASGVLGVIDETFTTSTNPTADTTYGAVWDSPFDVFRCTFSSHRDAAATGGTTGTIVDTALSTSADDRWNGALVYVYSGPAAGSRRTVHDYTGTSDTLTVSELFAEAITTSSNYIMLGNGSAGGDVINEGTVGVDIVDENTIDGDGTVAAEAGPLMMVKTPTEDLKNLMIHVIIRKHLFNTP